MLFLSDNFFSLLEGKDDIFGEDVRKWYFDSESIQGKSNYSVRAMSYCDLHTITIADLQDIMDSYPEFAGDFLQNFGVTFNLRQVSRVMYYTINLSASTLVRQPKCVSLQ